MSEQHEMNVKAHSEVAAEMTKLGLTPEIPEIIQTKPNQNDDGKGKTVEEPKKPEDKPEDEGTKKPEDEGGKDGKPERKVKYVPVEKHVSEKNALKAELESKDKIILELQGKVAPEKPKIDETDASFDSAFDEAIKDLGVTSPEEGAKLKKLFLAARSGDQKIIKELKSKVELIEEHNRDKKEVEQERNQTSIFNAEWDKFVPELEKEWGTLSKEEKDEAKSELEKLSLTDQWKDKELDYIYYKNKDQLVTDLGLKKKQGMQQGNTQGLTQEKSTERKGPPTLPENPTDADIKQYDKDLAGFMGGFDSLTSKGKDLV